LVQAQPLALTLSGIRPEVSPNLEGGGELKGLDPANLREAYKLPETGGSGQTVAIVDAYNDPKAEANLAVYREKYGLGSCTRANGCFKKVNQKGESSENEEASIYPAEEAEWSLEISLDLDMVSAVCKECHIVLVEAKESSFQDMDEAEDEAAGLKGTTEISNSWGSSERSAETSEDTYFVHPGIPITFSAGDTGDVVKYPAASGDVIAVGGTTLKKAENSRGWTETVWSGSGGGCSTYEEKPPWQVDKACSNRTDNDVAADASKESPVSVYDSYVYPGWENVWGTSAASPIISGIEAHATSATKTLSGDAFYKKPTMLFHISEGSNGSCGSESESTYYLCHATKEGYNGPTGEGTPDDIFESIVSAAATGLATKVAEREATLNGLVNPNGVTTKYYFEYGTTKSLGSKTAEVSVGAGTSNLEESKAITGLTPSTKYYFRVVTTNSKGTTDGLSQVLTTLAPSWSIQEFPIPSGAEDIYASGVSCASSTACIAVGKFWKIASKEYVPLGESWNGTVWTVQEASVPTGAKGATLWSLACTSSTACTAVGYFNNSSGVAVPLAESWNGTSWSVQEPPSPTGAKEAYLTGVSCTASTACTAVGYFDNSAGKVVPMAESWNGTSWTVQEPPSPAEAKKAALQDVSCTSSTACIATGYFESSAGKFLSLAESWNGTSWTVQEPPNPTGAERSSLEGVSCTSSTACRAVGYFENSSKKWVPLAESWNGTSWTAQEPPNPTGATEAVLEGVSCTSATACAAMGHFKNSASKEVPLAESWNGTSWTAQEPPSPTEAKGPDLKAVSCTSSAACIAVGYFENTSGAAFPLAESYH
jgi:hypothetical protein